MIKINKIQVLKEDTNQNMYTIRWAMFDPKKHFISTQEAKDASRKELHCSKKKMTEEYDSIYATWIKVGRGKNAHIEFNKTTKDAANTIFIIPKKYRRESYKIINNLELPFRADVLLKTLN